MTHSDKDELPRVLPEREVLQALMRWRTRISAAAWVIVQDAHAAEDIFQNVALKAMTHDVSFGTESALLSWAFVTARREGIDWLRRHQREATCLDAEILAVLEQELRIKAAHSEGAKLEALRECLESAPEDSRRLLKLRYFDGYSCGELAAQMGVGLNAIYKRVSRVHEKLRQCIEQKLGHAGIPGALHP
jgi:RNA polymerase sigma-70 factor (ECF subfamily)